jgi:hypothetical protein
MKWNMRLNYLWWKLIIISVRNHNWSAFYMITFLSFVRSKDWITLSTLVHIIAFTIILKYIWSNNWRSYENKWDWPMYNDPIIRPDSVIFNKGMRRKIHISIVIDEMEGRINRLSIWGRGYSSRIWIIFNYAVFIFYY